MCRQSLVALKKVGVEGGGSVEPWSASMQAMRRPLGCVEKGSPGPFDIYQRQRHCAGAV
jgi:hypothetical protein